MKITTLLGTVIFFFISMFQPVFTQNRNAKYTFKIIGKKELTLIPGYPEQINVSYDDSSRYHLIVANTNMDGRVLLKSRYIYSDQKFDLRQMREYLSKNKLLRDGIQTKYRIDGSIENESVYEAGILQKKTFYNPNGSRYCLISGNDKTLNGEYKIWHENGQLYFTGDYKNNLKNGEFQSFDKSGLITTQGVYHEGKLISGEPVVLDEVYENPEKPAEFINGEEAFDEYLKKKSATLDGRQEISSRKKVDLCFTIDKSGKITKVEFQNMLLPHELSLINRVFEELPGFKPALEENVPVSSIYKLSLTLSNQGLKRILMNDAIVNPGEMPQFPGGGDALRSYLNKNIMYPLEAQKNHLQGKVFVSFIVNEDGKISDVKLVRGVHYLLDIEAVRVVKNMPEWFPGKEDGKYVKVSYTMPINFSLR